ncbi:MAG: hypothetical protein ACLQDQ_16400 [Myxococcaceae bacterium]
MEAASYPPLLDSLFALASHEERKPDVLAAKAEYFRLTGEVFEDDRNFEMRMACFLDFYVFDYRSKSSGRTPAEDFHAAKLSAGAPDAAVVEGFVRTIHGLFEVRKLGPGFVRLRELFSGADHEVTERRALAGLQKGDVLEARLIPQDGSLVFSPAFCFHPREAVKAIKREVKRRKKKEPERPRQELVWEAAKRAMKVDRYRQIAVEKIYDFEQSRL